MPTKTVKIPYEYHMSALVPEDIAELCLSAKQATKLAYAPYSNFFVGASARLASGEIVQGANLENAAYPQ